ncbi:hypothetical protein [Facklamia sp. P9177]|uniref:hypothetical protein n=1 Tax=unclassified Facklamia TaxID=2622293 RepID=UPI003D175ACB
MKELIEELKKITIDEERLIGVSLDIGYDPEWNETTIDVSVKVKGEFEPKE